jgi:hypothetical protein
MFLSPCTSAPGDQDVEREGRNLLVPEQIFISPVFDDFCRGHRRREVAAKGQKERIYI